MVRELELNLEEGRGLKRTSSQRTGSSFKVYLSAQSGRFLEKCSYAFQELSVWSQVNPFFPEYNKFTSFGMVLLGKKGLRIKQIKF